MLASLSMISISLAGCGKSPGDRIFDAGTKAGAAQAQILLPDLPAECHADTPNATPQLGMDPVALDALDRGQTWLGNRKLRTCVGDYETLRKAIAAGTGAKG